MTKWDEINIYTDTTFIYITLRTQLSLSRDRTSNFRSDYGKDSKRSKIQNFKISKGKDSKIQEGQRFKKVKDSRKLKIQNFKFSKGRDSKIQEGSKFQSQQRWRLKVTHPQKPKI